MLQALKQLLPWRRSTPEVQEPVDWAWTHDTHIIEQYATQLLFVPDNMKKGFTNHVVLEEYLIGDEPHNDKVYTHNKFLAYRQDLGPTRSNAIIMPGDYVPSGFVTKGTAPNPAKIQGELYSVNSFKMYLLDKYKQNGVQFSRQRVRVTYPFRYVSKKTGSCVPPTISPHGFKTIAAWMYVGIPSYWDNRIGGVFAQPLTLHEHDPPRAWIGEFYRFDVKDN